jgi:hypothetical protein
VRVGEGKVLDSVDTGDLKQDNTVLSWKRSFKRTVLDHQTRNPLVKVTCAAKLK